MIALLFSMALFFACKENKTLYELSPVSENGIHHALISIPAGTVELYQYDPAAGVFKVKNDGKKDESVDYLPFPVNYGFLPSTFKDSGSKDINDPLNVFIVSPTFSKTTLIEIQPLGSAIYISGSGDEIVVPVVVPSDPQFRSLDVSDYSTFMQYPEAMSSIESFYRYWKKDDNLTFTKWQDDIWTQEYIELHTDYDRVNYRGKNTAE
jgi:inorganic pyrophosphatase